VPRNVLLEGFDRASSPWRAVFAAEDGVAATRLLETGEGAPGGDAAERQSVLGLRVDFFRRGRSSLVLLAPRPLPVEGRCSALSLRVLGRSYRHSLSLLLFDYYGALRELPLGRLDFPGWRTLRVYLRAGDGPGRPWIAQDDAHYTRAPGIRVAGIKLDFEPEDAYGTFYAYFDELRAETRGEPEAETAADAAPTSPASPVSEDIGEGPPSPQAAPEAAPAARVLALISERIGSALVYPDAARRRGVEGSLVAAFVVGAGGELESAEVAESSGSEILDRAGLELLRSVFPVPNDAGGALRLRIKIAYRLSDSR